VCGFFHYVAALLLRTVSPLRGWLDNNNRRVSCTPHFPRMNSSSPWWKTLLTGRLRIILDRTRVGVRAQEALWSHRATPVGQRIRSVLHNTHPSTRLSRARDIGTDGSNGSFAILFMATTCLRPCFRNGCSGRAAAQDPPEMTMLIGERDQSF